MAEDKGTLKLDPKYDQFDYPIVSANTQSGHPGHTTPEQEAQGRNREGKQKEKIENDDVREEAAREDQLQ